MIKFLEYLRPFIESSLLLQEIGFYIFEKFPQFLPHDIDYLFVKSFKDMGPETLFLDIGANNGLSARSFFKLCPNVSVISFEPNPALFSRLNKISKIYKNYNCFQFGIGSVEKDSALLVPMRQGLPDKTQAFVVNAQAQDQDRNYQEHKIKIRTLDSFNLDPFFIKIDTEGFEFEVLKGMTETIIKSKPHLLIEVTDSIYTNCQCFLESFDYTENFYNSETELLEKGRGKRKNTIWIHKSKLKNFYK